MIRITVRGSRGRGSRGKNAQRQVAIAEVHLEDKFAYALEIERTNQQHAILVLARVDCQRISADVLQAILLLCALRRGWVLEDQTAGISTNDNYPPGTGEHCRLGITNLAEDHGD